MYFVVAFIFILFFVLRASFKTLKKNEDFDNKPFSGDKPRSDGYERAKMLAENEIQKSQETSVVLEVPPPISPEGFFQKHLKAYVSFDLETTGLDAESCRIIEIGAVKVLDGQIIDTFQTFVNPGIGRHIPPEASAINHITDDMVASAPFYGTAIPSFVEFIEDLPLVAHNAVFDIKFMYAAFSELDIPKPLFFADSLKMARQCFPGLPNKKLGTVCDHIGYQIGQAHRALDDAKAVHAIVQACAEASCQMQEYEQNQQLHLKLSKQIEEQYKRSQQVPDQEGAMLDEILFLCYQDFGLVESVRKYYSLRGWPPPAFPSFNRAIIILSKQKEFDAAISICQQAAELGIPYSSLPGGMAERKEKLIERKTAYENKEKLLQNQAEARAARETRQAEKQAFLASKPDSEATNKRPVLQFSYDGSELIKEHESIASAAKAIGIDKSCIRDAVKGKQKHAGGFTWKYANEFKEGESA